MFRVPTIQIDHRSFIIKRIMDSHFESTYPATAREKEIAKIIAFIREGNSCQLIGLPGVGRSTMLGMLAYNHAIRAYHLGEEQKRFHFVRIDFAEIRTKPLPAATKFLFLNLLDSLRDRRYEAEYAHIKTLFDETVQSQDELVLFQGLKHAIDYIAGERELTLIFLFDRFDQYVPRLSAEFFTNLRTLRNRAKFRFSVVFSLGRPLDELIEPELFADFYEYVAGHSVFVAMYDTVALKHRLETLAQKTGKELTSPLCEEIVRQTGGFGKLAKLSAEALLSNELPIENTEQFLLSMRTIRGALTEIWQSLTPSEQEVLQHVQAGGDEQARKYLEVIGLLHENRLTIPLLASWLSQQTPQENISDHKIRFDEATNTIRKGELVFSDQLTASEFRLLKHLLQHPEQVVDREEIITVVWKDAKSTAGVTDQAVDQLIFRLRKKIEENPNQPVHLQTVKGRGFKFTV
jgi:DNA-binding response OmpR family regulator